MKLYKDMKLPKESKWTILEPIKNQRTKVKVRCECGKEKKISPQILFDGRSMNCDQCSHFKKIKGFESIGGLRKHPAYGVLDAIKQRCNNKKSKLYKYYGGIGIKVCDEWNNSYSLFCEWADNNGYKKGLTIDRIDVNGNYEPSNCRFITKKDQRENRHIQSNNTSGHTGISFNKGINKWESYYTLDGIKINIGYFANIEDAIKARESELKNKNINYIRSKYVNI